MIKKLLKNALLLISLFFLNCENKRKQNTLTEKSTHTYRSLKTGKLNLDYYKPKGINDVSPLVIYIHGGGFSNGKRDGKKIVNLAQKLAENGYATISLSYRLTRKNLGFNCTTSALDKIKTFDAASEDINYAINYILKNKSIFKIDENHVVLIGSSAGAEAMLNLVYTYTENTLPKEFKFAGLISRAGALTSLDNMTSRTAVAMQLFHGENDDLVPYENGSHHNCKKYQDGYLNLYGSKAIANRLKQLNKPYHLVTLKDGNHGMRGFSQKDYFNEILEFLITLRTNTTNQQIESFY